MTHDELREKVARAIEATIRYAVEPDARANQMTPDELSMLADAAIDIVLEEAARVAEAKSDEWTAEWRKGLKCDSHLEGKSDGADDIAAAIRAMKGESNDTR